MNDTQLAASEALLRACEALKDEYTRLANSVDAAAHDWPGMYAIDDAITGWKRLGTPQVVCGGVK